MPLRAQAYIDRYSYEHVPICGAVDEHSNVSFSFHVDKVNTYSLHAKLASNKCSKTVYL